MAQLAARTRAEPLEPRPDLDARPAAAAPLLSEPNNDDDQEEGDDDEGVEAEGGLRRIKGGDTRGGGSATPPLREEGFAGAAQRANSTDSGDGSEGSSAESSLLDVTTQGGTSLCEAAAPVLYQVRFLTLYSPRSSSSLLLCLPCVPSLSEGAVNAL